MVLGHENGLRLAWTQLERRQWVAVAEVHQTQQ
jgi:hypothetical protein